MKTTWDYPLMAARAIKAGSRTSTPTDPDTAHDLVGVDASILGGLRPHYGFRYFHQLARTGSEIDAADAPDGTDLGVTVQCEIDPPILDVHSFTVRAGPTSYIYGFAYLVRVEGDLYYTVVDYRIGTDTTWHRRWVAGGYAADAVTSAQMSVATYGRFLYIGISGHRQTVVYWDWENSPPDPDPISVQVPGPGEKPELIPHDQNLGLQGITGMSAGQVARGQIILSDLLPSTSAVWASDPPQDDSDTRTLKPGDYAFAYRLYNSGTGRWSALSNPAPIQAVDFEVADSSSSGTTSEAKYAILDLVLDEDAWPQETTHIYVYRSVRTQSAGPIFYAAILHPDNLIQAVDYAADESSGGAGTYEVVYWYDLEDKELVFQAPYRDHGSFEEEPPYAGALGMYENTMFCSVIRGGSAAEIVGQGPFKGVGELRWSSLVDPTPEMFPPHNRYVPNVPSNEILTFKEVSGNLIGFSRDRQYHVHKEGTYLRVQEMHTGFGTVNSHAAAVVGSLAYFINEKGIKVVDADGQLESLHSVDEIIMGRWATSLAGTSIGYDAGSNVLYILNPEEDEAILVWFNTSTVTTLEDLPFTKVFEGNLPADLDDTTTSLVSRSIFLGPESYLYVPDYTRSRVIAGANDYNDEFPYTLMDFEGDAIFNVTGTTLNRITVNQGTLGSDRMVGLKVYNITPTSDYFGYSATIDSIVGSTIYLSDSLAASFANCHIGISPVLVRWVGHQIGLTSENGATFGPRNMFQQRRVEALGAHFSDLTFNHATPARKNYEALLYRGNNDSPVSKNAPLAAADGTTLTQGSIVEDEATNWAQLGKSRGFTDVGVGAVTFTDTLPTSYGAAALFPGIETFIPRLDYRLLAARVAGKINQSDRQVGAS
jgi:hypothetical protein